MKINATTLIYFSPTKTTKTILEAVASGLTTETITHMDLTTPASEQESMRQISKIRADQPDGQIAVFGAPVYGGRVPKEAEKRFRGLLSKIHPGKSEEDPGAERGVNTSPDKTGNIPAVIVAVYGNRDYDDALLELSDLAQNAGFVPVAAAAFIGEHSFADDDHPIAYGRPDQQDKEKAAQFGRSVREKIQSTGDVATILMTEIPGDRPYKERGKRAPLAPKTVSENCTLCGECAALCPTGAITVNGEVKTDADLCMRCCACIKLCPENARFFDDEGIRNSAKTLWEKFGTRKEPEWFI